MAVAFDAVSNVAAGTGNLSWTHTPVGTPKGVFVAVVGMGTTDAIDTITYGGVALTEVAGSPVVSTGGEGGAVHAFFLGSGLPTGAQTVLVTVLNTTASRRAVAWTVTAAADTELVDVDATVNSTALANPSVTLPLGGRTCFACLAGHSGQNAVTGTTQLTNWTADIEHDFGNETAVFYRYTIIGSTDVTAGWTQTSDDAQMIAVAIGEVVAGGPTRHWLGLLGAGA